jgi:hypothetical protein
MKSLTRLISFGVMAVALVLFAVGVVNMQKANAGLQSLDAVYAAQGVELTYNDDGQLVDRGETAGADAIKSLMIDDWKFPADLGDLDPNDPLVNTPTELMYQYATISYHVLHGTQTIVLDEAVEYNGETFAAGPHEFAIDGRYWTDFDRNHPLEGPARGMAWNGAHGLLASISSGLAADYQAGFAHFAAWRTMLIALAFGLVGLGLFAASRKEEIAQAQVRERELETTR